MVDLMKDMTLVSNTRKQFQVNVHFQAGSHPELRTLISKNYEEFG